VTTALLPVKAQFEWTSEQMSEGLRVHLRNNSGALKANQRLNQIVGGILVCFGVATLFRGIATIGRAFPMVVLTILLGLCLIFRDRLFVWILKLTFRKNPNKDVLVSWTFSPETISSEGEGFNFTMSWSKVFTFVDSPRGFLIYPQKQVFHWIPFSGFQNESEVDCIRQIAKSQVISYKKVS
jgi:hypothetical protein